MKRVIVLAVCLIALAASGLVTTTAPSRAGELTGNTPVKVPNLYHVDTGEAGYTLRHLGLHPKHHDVPGYDSQGFWWVCKQRPVAGTEVARGTVVDLYEIPRGQGWCGP